MRRFYLLLVLLGCTWFTLPASGQSKLILVGQPSPEELLIRVDSQAHIDYGFSYPLTYIVRLPFQQSGLRAYYRYNQGTPWLLLPEKSSEEFFNGVKAARFATAEQSAYLSIEFSAGSDSLFLKITDAARNSLPLVFGGISTYYDNREMAVTGSADDMAGWSKAKFQRTLNITRSYRLWFTCGINSGGADASVYRYIQAQLDSGYVEAACHSRSHPGLPYPDYDSEITGNKEDIINKLVLPASFTAGDREYVYTWIAPNGTVDDQVTARLIANKFLFNRLYVSNFFGFADWNPASGMYRYAGVTRAFDPPRSQLGWGIGTNSVSDLNGAFDKALAQKSVYHVMCHPNVVEWDKPYPTQHLAYISNRKDVWYVGVGHLYLYHLAQTSTQAESSVLEDPATRPESLALLQNYPNPFNPQTTIRYRLATPAEVELAIYNERGERVAVLAQGMQGAGEYRVLWQGGGLAAGVYFCRLRSADQVLTRKMLLVR